MLPYSHEEQFAYAGARPITRAYPSAGMDTCIALHLHPLHPTIVGAVAGAAVNAQWGAVGSSVSAVVRAVAFHQCVPGSIPGPDIVCGLTLLILYSAPRGFSLGSPVFPSRQKPTFDLICVNLI